MRWAVMRMGASALVAGLLIGGCTPTPQFSGMMRYGNLMAKPRAHEATAGAREQILARAAAHGIDPVHQSRDRLIFRIQAPRYLVTLEDGTAQERVDPRVVRVEVRFDARTGQDVYRYECIVEGAEPPVFSDEDRARFGLAMLALREILETPIETDILGG
jgi:hypothetical protein